MIEFGDVYGSVISAKDCFWEDDGDGEGCDRVIPRLSDKSEYF